MFCFRNEPAKFGEKGGYNSVVGNQNHRLSGGGKFKYYQVV